MFSAPGTNPDASWWGSHGRCVRLLAWVQMAPGHAQTQLPWGPTRRPPGQEKLVPSADNILSPYFEGAESISGLDLTWSQAFGGP